MSTLEIMPPLVITSRLLPGVQVRDADGLAEISIEPSGRDRDGKPGWRYYIDLPDGVSHEDSDLHGWGDYREMLGTLLCFLGACGESYGTGEPDQMGENADLFPPAVAEWAHMNADELSMLQYEIENPEGE